MEGFLEKFSEWPTLYKVGAWLGILLFSTYIFWQYLYKEPARKLERAMEKIENLESNIRNQRLLARNLTKVREEVKALDEKLAVALQELPNKQETSQLLASISDLARDAGLEVELFSEKGENYKEFYGQKSVALTVNGSFHQIATFFDEVGQLSRIVNINGVSLRQPTFNDEGRISLKSDCQATTYWYLDESERRSHEEQATDNKKRRRK
ncbi:MAG: type 4a pilus biogenesis protein PilO [Bdellovibrionales bacterium]|nr:type 4a pilus biogenesis protein PilO [Bdellovibrionales bacterium]